MDLHLYTNGVIAYIGDNKLSRNNRVVNKDPAMPRPYRKSRRADLQEETRNRIIRATMELHVEKGVATTSYPDVAARAGVGAASVYRHFPSLESLVDACGAHFWEEIDAPTPTRAAGSFSGLNLRAERIEQLVIELDAFYARAEAPLWSAVRDQDRSAALARFLAEVAKGISAFTAAALQEEAGSRSVRLAAALVDFSVWRSLAATGLDRSEVRKVLVTIIDTAVLSGAPTGQVASSPN